MPMTISGFESKMQHMAGKNASIITIRDTEDPFFLMHILLIHMMLFNTPECQH